MKRISIILLLTLAASSMQAQRIKGSDTVLPVAQQTAERFMALNPDARITVTGGCLLHISEIDWKRLETVEEAGIKEGDEIEVKLLDIDPKTGKFKLSRKVLLPRPERQERPEKK